MRQFFVPADAPLWLRAVLNSIRDALSDVWNTALRLKDYATADLPPAADWKQGVVYDSTTTTPKFSDGSFWYELLSFLTGMGVAATRTALAASSPTSAGLSRYLRESGREGHFVFSTSNLSTQVTADPLQGVYVAPASDTTGASGAWVRKGWTKLDIRWFGAAIDNATNDGAAVLAAVALSKALAVNVSSNGFYKAGPDVYVPGVGTVFMGTNTVELTHTVKIVGDGTAFNGKSYASTLRWSADTTAIRIQAYNTSGSGTVDGVTHFSGAGSHFDGIALVGGYAGTEGEFHGIHAKERFTFNNISIGEFQGDGLHVNATVGSGIATEGNANLWHGTNGAFIGNRDGVSVGGGGGTADVNAGGMSFCDCSYNRRWGINDLSFLGNTYVGIHLDANGLGTGLPSATLVSNGVNRYYVIDGQAAGASVNAPPAGATDNTWWGYAYAGADSVPLGIPLWTNGVAVREGGTFHTNNPNAATVFSGCYTESGSAPAQTVAPSLIVGGFNGAGEKGTGTRIYNDLGFVTVPKLTVSADLNATGPVGLGATTLSSITTTPDLSVIHSFGRYSAGLPSAYMDTPAGTTSWKFRTVGSERLHIDSAGISVAGAAAVSTTLNVTGLATLTAGAAIAGDITATGARKFTTSGTSNSLEQTGDTLGTSRITVKARSGALGAEFEQTHATATLFDIIFITQAAGAHNIRYERRGGVDYFGHGTAYELQFGAPAAPDAVISDAGVWIAAGNAYYVGGDYVVNARKTGWSVDTGTSKRTANATYAAGATLTFTDPPTAAEMGALATRLAAVEASLQDDTRTMKALKDDLHNTAGHGLIGT
jgi:hypothetical protein